LAAAAAAAAADTHSPSLALSQSVGMLAAAGKAGRQAGRQKGRKEGRKEGRPAVRPDPGGRMQLAVHVSPSSVRLFVGLTRFGLRAR
jgi:hypothetical protein